MDTNSHIVPDIHIGNVIEKVLEKKRITQTEFAKMMFMLQSNVSRMLKRRSMDINKLIIISMKLEYNFFEEYCGREDVREYNGKFVFPIVHIGDVITEYIKSSGISQLEFAKMMGIAQPEASRLLKREAVDTSKLEAVSNVLQHNFFEEYCKVESVAQSDANNEVQPPSIEFQELLSRYEKLTVENVKLKARVYELEQLLLANGIKE